MKIKYWSDYACPYCYIGEMRLKKAIENLGLQNDVVFERHAYELDPTAPKDVQSTTVVRFAKKYRLSESQAAAQIEQISQLGRELGIDFKYATTLYTNTFDAHRLTKLAISKNDPALADRIEHLLFDAYFTKNLKLADHEVLVSVAKEAGMDESEVRTMLDSDRFAKEVRKDEEDAYDENVRGVPYFVFNDKIKVPGAMSIENCEHALKRGIEAQRLESEIKKDVHQCDGDSCTL